MLTASFLLEGLLIIGVSVIVPTLAAGLFYVWMGSRRFEKDEDRIQAWDVFLKGMGTLTAITAGVLAVLQYIHTTDQAAKSERTRREFETEVLKQELAHQSL